MIEWVCCLFVLFYRILSLKKKKQTRKLNRKPQLTVLRVYHKAFLDVCVCPLPCDICCVPSCEGPGRKHTSPPGSPLTPDLEEQPCWPFSRDLPEAFHKQMLLDSFSLQFSLKELSHTCEFSIIKPKPTAIVPATLMHRCLILRAASSSSSEPRVV